MSIPLDYYSILDLKRDANDTQIKLAYRKKALKYHPLKHTTTSNTIPSSLSTTSASAAINFRLISEAFDVLSAPILRAHFDQSGEEGLKSHTTIYGTPYTFTRDPIELFQQQFGTTSPFADYFNQQQQLIFPTRTEGDHNDIEQHKSVEDVLVNLYVSLEELYGGCTKNYKLTRNRIVINSSGQRTLQLQDKIFAVEIGAGWKENTKIKFIGDGNDELVGIDGVEGSNNNSHRPSGDVIFVVRIKPHPRFRRSGDDIVHNVELTLLEALTGTKTIELELLDGRIVPIGITDIVTNKSEKRIKGEGLTRVGGKKKEKREERGERGDLVLNFDIDFPTQLSLEQKEGLVRILS